MTAHIDDLIIENGLQNNRTLKETNLSHIKNKIVINLNMELLPL